LHVKNKGTSAICDLTVIPVPADAERAIPDGLFLVLIEENLASAPRPSTESAVDGACQQE